MGTAAVIPVEEFGAITHRKTEPRVASTAAGLLLTALLSACGGGGESPDAPADEATAETFAPDSSATDDEADENEDRGDD